MPKLICRDYGFRCSFKIEDEDNIRVIEEFGKHTEKRHGIEYPKEALMQFLLRKLR